MPRWSVAETKKVQQIRQLLAPQLAASPPFPEVVGDRKIIRFLRGHDHNVTKAAEMMSKFLTWRKQRNVDDIRTNIVELGLNHPIKFPNGELIMSLIPQLVIGPSILDKYGSPLCVEQIAFSPSEIIENVSLEEYLDFMIYCLEYKSLILEQMSEENERQFLASLDEYQRPSVTAEWLIDMGGEGAAMLGGDDASGSKDTYGQIANLVIIRDLAGISVEHVGSTGQDIMKSVVTLASDMYPELMKKTYLVNTPWVFHTLWYFLKGLLSTRTIDKFAVLGEEFMPILLKDISSESMPDLLGGKRKTTDCYKPYSFDFEYFCPHLSATERQRLQSAAAATHRQYYNSNASDDRCSNTGDGGAIGTTQRNSVVDSTPVVTTNYINDNNKSDSVQQRPPATASSTQLPHGITIEQQEALELADLCNF